MSEHLKSLFMILTVFLLSKLKNKETSKQKKVNLSRLPSSFRETMVEIVPVSHLHPLNTLLRTSLQRVTLKFLLQTIVNNRICN